MEISQLIMEAQKTFATHFSSDGHSKMVKQVSTEDILLKYEENTQTKGIRFFDSPCTRNLDIFLICWYSGLCLGVSF